MTGDTPRNQPLPVEVIKQVGTMQRTTRMFKRNGGPRKSMYKTMWDVPRMNGDDTMAVLAKKERGSK